MTSVTNLTVQQHGRISTFLKGMNWREITPKVGIPLSDVFAEVPGAEAAADHKLTDAFVRLMYQRATLLETLFNSTPVEHQAEMQNIWGGTREIILPPVIVNELNDYLTENGFEDFIDFLEGADLDFLRSVQNDELVLIQSNNIPFVRCVLFRRWLKTVRYYNVTHSVR